MLSATVYLVLKYLVGFHSAICSVTDWRSRGHKVKLQLGHITFIEIDYEIISSVILPLALIQEGQLSVIAIPGESSLYKNSMSRLTLKAPRKTASENVVCLCRLLNILANFSNLFLHTANSVDPDQTAPRGAV